MSDRYTVLENHLGKLEVQMFMGMPYIHCTLNKWSPTLYKAYLRVFASLLSQLNRQGHPMAFSVIPTGDNKLYKFQEMFGFKEEMREGNKILMCISTDKGA
jgi:hypothetical protein